MRPRMACIAVHWVSWRKFGELHATSKQTSRRPPWIVCDVAVVRGSKGAIIGQAKGGVVGGQVSRQVTELGVCMLVINS